MAAQVTAKPDALSIAETKAYDALESEFAEVRHLHLRFDDCLTGTAVLCKAAMETYRTRDIVPGSSV